MVLAQCETGPLSSELAVQLNQCLLLQFYTAVPAQRAPAIYSMQVVDASEDLHRPKGNYAMLQPSSGVWSLTFNEHKTDKHGAMPSFELPPDGQFSMRGALPMAERGREQSALLPWATQPWKTRRAVHF